MTLNIGDTVRWCDDPNQTGTVLKISDQVRRSWEGSKRPDLSPMVYVQWNRSGRKQWQTPDLLVRIES